MKKIDLGQTIGVLANVGVIAGIVFLAFEMRQNTRAIEISSSRDFLAGGSSLDLLIAQDAEIAYILTHDPEELTPEERFRGERFRYSAIRQWENAFFLYRQSALSEDFWLAYRNEIANIVSPSDRMEQYWKANRSSFTPAFNAELEAIFAEGRVE